MAFAPKIDFCGLSSIGDGKILVRNHKKNGSNETYMPTGGSNEYLAVEVFGEDAAPTNDYGLSGKVEFAEGDLTLGKTIEVGPDNAKKSYALEQVTISTNGGSPVTISATSQLVDKPIACQFKVPAFTLETKHHAQILFGAFTLGTSDTLTACSATIGSKVTKDKLVGKVISSDVGQGIITVTGTILSKTGNAPTFAAKDDSWIVTKPPEPSEDNPETAFMSYTFEVVKILPKTEVTAA